MRERAPASETEREHQDLTERPAHPSNPLVAQLRERWRVVDDPLQWILQRKKGHSRKKNSGWQGRSFCRTRGLLVCIRESCCSPDQGELRCIREYQGIDKVALEQVRALLEWRPDWDRKKDPTNLDVHGTDQEHVGEPSEPLVPGTSEAFDADEYPPQALLSLSISLLPCLRGS